MRPNHHLRLPRWHRPRDTAWAAPRRGWKRLDQQSDAQAGERSAHCIKVACGSAVSIASRTAGAGSSTLVRKKTSSKGGSNNHEGHILRDRDQNATYYCENRAAEKQNAPSVDIADGAHEGGHRKYNQFVGIGEPSDGGCSTNVGHDAGGCWRCSV